MKKNRVGLIVAAVIGLGLAFIGGLEGWQLSKAPLLEIVNNSPRAYDDIVLSYVRGGPDQVVKRKPLGAIEAGKTKSLRLRPPTGAGLTVILVWEKNTHPVPCAPTLSDKEVYTLELAATAEGSRCVKSLDQP